MREILKSKRVLLPAMNLSLAFRVVVILRRMGVLPYVLGPEGRASLFNTGRFARRYIAFDAEAMGYDQDPLLDALGPRFVELLNEVCTRHAIDVVLPVDNTMIMTLARHRHLLAAGAALAPIPDEGLLRMLHDKWAFSRLLARLNLPQPATRLLPTPKDVDKLDLSYPLVIKPVAHGGGLDVTRVADAEEAVLRVREHLARFPGDRMIAQAWIDGEDFQVCVFAQAGEVRAWSMCAMRGKGVRAFIEVPEVIDYCRRIVKRTGYEGAIQFDLMQERATGEFRFLEANLRFPASTYYHFRAGVNYVGLSLVAALGHDVAQFFQPVRPLIIEQSLLDGILVRGNDKLVAHT